MTGHTGITGYKEGKLFGEVKVALRGERGGISALTDPCKSSNRITRVVRFCFSIFFPVVSRLLSRTMSERKDDHQRKVVTQTKIGSPISAVRFLAGS